MEKIDAKTLKEMQDLIDKINKFNYHYYTLDDPIITDGEYDKIYEQLINLEDKTKVVLKNSPSIRVGGEILEKFEKYTHKAPLYSLDKAQSYDELRTWYEKNRRFVEEYNNSHSQKLNEINYIVELKFDGLTINLTYEDGYLKTAATRGNGRVGEIILEQVKTIYSIPLSISYKGIIEVQGEGLMPLSALDRYNKTAKEKLKNARNAAAGALRNLDPKVTRKRHLTAYFYNIGYIEDKNFKDDIEMKNFLKKEKFLTSNINYCCKTFDEIVEKIEEIGNMRETLDVLIDGVTIKINDFKTREKLGFTNKFPRWAIAYKFEAEEVSTRLLEVVWNVGRSSKVTPSAMLEPVEIGGVTVKRATLNNIDDINRKKLRLNSRVLLRRSNDVIPEILGALPTKEKTFEIKEPKLCPSCGTELYRNGVHIFCPNTLSCKPQLISRLTHFASRDAMNIEGLSEKTITKLLLERGISEIADIYELKYEDIISLEGFKEKRTNNLLNSIENSKNVVLENFIYALGINNVGIKTARDLANYYKSFSNFRNAKIDELINISDIGPITAKEIDIYFKDRHIVRSIDRLLKNGIKPFYEDNSKENLLFKDKVIVITGSLSRSRKELEEELINMGAKVTTSVSKKTDYLIVGETPGSKYDKARELGTEIIDENKLKEMMEE